MSPLVYVGAVSLLLLVFVVCTAVLAVALDVLCRSVARYIR